MRRRLREWRSRPGFEQANSHLAAAADNLEAYYGSRRRDPAKLGAAERSFAKGMESFLNAEQAIQAASR